MLIGISGEMRTGKDTVADYIINTYDFKHLKFTKGINDIYDKYNYQYKDEVKPRRALQIIGQEVRKALGEDVWVEYAMSEYGETQPTVFSDVRLEQEFKAIKSRGGVIIRLMTSPGEQLRRLETLGELTDERLLKHKTESIPKGLEDYIVVNDGTLEELYEKIDDIIKTLKV